MTNPFFIHIFAGSFLTGLLCSCASSPRLPFQPSSRPSEWVWTERNPATPQTLVQRSQEVLDNLKPQIDPYWGTVHLSPTCDPRLLPPPETFETPTAQTRVLYMYASAHRNLGLCSQKFDVLRVQITFIYCKKEQRLFEIYRYSPKKTDWFRDIPARCREETENVR